MEGSLPQELLEVFERSTSADFVTVDAHGRPLAWSVEPSFDARAVCIEVGPVPTLRQALVNPHVALLFAEEAPRPMVLVQGTAKAREAGVRVRPERVYVWQRADLEAEPVLYDSHVEEVRSAHNEEPEVGPPPPEGGPVAWDDRIDELGTGYPRAVLAFVGPDGFPFAVSVPVGADRAAGVVRIGADPVGAPIESGVACLCAADLRVRGDLEEERGGWTLRPHAMIGAVEG
jgi:pyridoxamine 5'-phosphate oxidase-like protein